MYNKALRLSSYSMTGGSMTMGQITNHMSVDATNILNSFQWIHYIWSIPYLVTYLDSVLTFAHIAAIASDFMTSKIRVKG